MMPKFTATASLVGAALLLLALTTQARAGEADFPTSVGQTCRAQARDAEQRHQLPKLVLSAISLAESGRWHPAKRKSYPWPWTVTSGADSAYFSDKASAIAAVQRLQAEGVSNIDVGCMQVNLHYHPDAFSNLEAAFDPAANTEYAAVFLKGLFRSTKSWDRAIGRYHSATPARAEGYIHRVKALWRTERVQVAESRREAVKAAYRERQEALRAARTDS
ncbi:MAG: transglycosylase SLT domain-containing protein [Alphaproteobacteria bacterium]